MITPELREIADAAEVIASTVVREAISESRKSVKEQVSEIEKTTEDVILKGMKRNVSSNSLSKLESAVEEKVEKKMKIVAFKDEAHKEKSKSKLKKFMNKFKNFFKKIKEQLKGKEKSASTSKSDMKEPVNKVPTSKEVAESAPKKAVGEKPPVSPRPSKEAVDKLLNELLVQREMQKGIRQIMARKPLEAMDGKKTVLPSDITPVTQKTNLGNTPKTPKKSDAEIMAERRAMAEKYTFSGDAPAKAATVVAGMPTANQLQQEIARREERGNVKELGKANPLPSTVTKSTENPLIDHLKEVMAKRRKEIEGKRKGR